MILRAVLNTIRAVFNAITKVIAWLLIALGLWLPAIYCVVVFLACAVTDTKFSSISTAFFLGLLIMFMLSIWYTMSTGKRKQSKKSKHIQTPSYLAKIRERESELDSPSSLPSNGSIFRPNSPLNDNTVPSNEGQPSQPLDLRNHRPIAYQQQYEQSYASYEQQRLAQEYQGQNSTTEQSYTQQPLREQQINGQTQYNAQPMQTSERQTQQDFQQHARRQYDNNSQYSQASIAQSPISPPVFSQYNFSSQSEENSLTQPQFQSYKNDQPSWQSQPQQQLQPQQQIQQQTQIQQQSQIQSQQIHQSQQQLQSQIQQQTQIQPTSQSQPLPQYYYQPQQQQNEVPKLLLSRRDSTLVIYEYSNRLEFYRKTNRGLEYETTRYK